jgi:hypothetical protein
MPFEPLNSNQMTRAVPVVKFAHKTKLVVNAAGAKAICAILGLDQKDRPDVWVEFFIDKSAREIAIEPHATPTPTGTKLSWNSQGAGGGTMSSKQMREEIGAQDGDAIILTRSSSSWVIGSY